MNQQESTKIMKNNENLCKLLACMEFSKNPEEPKKNLESSKGFYRNSRSRLRVASSKITKTSSQQTRQAKQLSDPAKQLASRAASQLPVVAKQQDSLHPRTQLVSSIQKLKPPIMQSLRIFF